MAHTAIAQIALTIILCCVTWTIKQYYTFAEINASEISFNPITSLVYSTSFKKGVISIHKRIIIPEVPYLVITVQ